MQPVKFMTRGVLCLILVSSAILADPVLTIQPPQLTLNPGATFSLDVDIQGAADVYAFQFNLNFSSTLISPVSVSEGSFLANGGTTFFVPTMRAGQVSAVADTLLGPVPGASGNGTLATLNFNTPMPFPGFDFSGTTTVGLSNVILLNSHLGEIPTTVVPGVVNVVPEPATWGVAGLTLLGLICMYRRKCRTSTWVVIPALLLLSGPAHAAAPGYTFTILAQTGDTIDGKTLTSVGSPIINNEGTVAFQGSFDGGSGIFTDSKLLVQTGDTIGGNTLTDILEFVMNNAGTVAFLGTFPGGVGLFTPSALLVKTGDVIDGGTLLSIANVRPGQAVYVIGGVHSIGINAAGVVVFEADYTESDSYGLPVFGKGIFTNNALVSGTTGPTRPDVYDPQINDAGTVVFVRPVGIDVIGIFTQSGFLDGEPVADHPVINNAGSIAFFCGSDNEFVTINGICTHAHLDFWGTGAIIGGKTLTQVPSWTGPALNDAGTVAFVGEFAGPQPPFPFVDELGIFSPSELLVATGDSIAGKIFSYGFLGSINNSGAIVFGASFSDGTAGIVMATPISSGVAGDVNGDGVVDCNDLTFMTNILGKAYGQAGFDPRADMNGDGVIDIRDLAFVAQHLSAGATCP